MNPQLFRLNRTLEHDPAIDAWMNQHAGELGALARHWFQFMQNRGDEVRELLHDGCPTACFGDVPFAYINIITSHVNVGFFQGASLADPAHILQGTGKFMRHVKLRPTPPTHGVPHDQATLSKAKGCFIVGGSSPESQITPDSVALTNLIKAAYTNIKSQVENG